MGEGDKEGGAQDDEGGGARSEREEAGGDRGPRELPFDALALGLRMVCAYGACTCARACA